MIFEKINSINSYSEVAASKEENFRFLLKLFKLLGRIIELMHKIF
jgi:hypothetical protein